MGAALTQDTLDMVKGAIAAPNDDITKSYTVSTGLTAYDLQAPAKNLYPVITPLRNSIPRVGGGTGPATNWRAVTAITGSGFASMPWVPEGQRSGRMSVTVAPKAANYVTIGEEDQMTFEADSAAQGFEDVRASMTMRLLQQTMIKEEIAILGGNNSLTVSAPGTPTLSAAGTGATLGAATYVVYAVALTFEGYMQSSLAGGVATTKTITGADGQTYTLNGGASNKSAASAGQAITLGQTLSASVTAVNGAVGYAWFVGTAGNEKLELITTINSATFATALVGTGQAATAITADYSKNALAFDGLLTAAFTPGSGAYVKVLPSGVAGTGSTLTASGYGTVTEIDNMLQTMWDTSRISATALYVNSQELRNITKKCLSTSGNASLLQYNNQAADGKPYSLTAGGVIASYFNPYTPDGGRMIPVRIHPNLPPGTILGYADQLPLYYQSNNVSNVCEIKTRRDYYQIDWPQKTRAYETGVYSEQVLAIYAAFSIGVITNIANG